MLQKFLICLLYSIAATAAYLINSGSLPELYFWCLIMFYASITIFLIDYILSKIYSYLPARTVYPRNMRRPLLPLNKPKGNLAEVKNICLKLKNDNEALVKENETLKRLLIKGPEVGYSRLKNLFVYTQQPYLFSGVAGTYTAWKQRALEYVKQHEESFLDNESVLHCFIQWCEPGSIPHKFLESLLFRINEVDPSVDFFAEVNTKLDVARALIHIMDDYPDLDYRYIDIKYAEDRIFQKQGNLSVMKFFEKLSNYSIILDLDQKSILNIVLINMNPEIVRMLCYKTGRTNKRDLTDSEVFSYSISIEEEILGRVGRDSSALRDYSRRWSVEDWELIHEARACYNCGRSGHFHVDCRRARTEGTKALSENQRHWLRSSIGRN